MRGPLELCLPSKAHSRARGHIGSAEGTLRQRVRFRGPNLGKCLKYLEAIRWPHGPACLRCGDMDVAEIKDREPWYCRSCHYHFSVTAGSIMHDSHLPPRKRFAAIYLMCESKKGMSAIQREGEVRLERIPDAKQRTLHEFIARTVKDEAEAIYTDELKSYLGIADHDTHHEIVNHSIEEWVVGNMPTNGIEGV